MKGQWGDGLRCCQKSGVLREWQNQDQNIAAATTLPRGSPISEHLGSSRVVRRGVLGWETHGALGGWRPLVPNLALRNLAHTTYHANPNALGLPPPSHSAAVSCPRDLARSVGTGSGQNVGQWRDHLRPEGGINCACACLLSVASRSWKGLGQQFCGHLGPISDVNPPGPEAPFHCTFLGPVVSTGICEASTVCSRRPLLPVQLSLNSLSQGMTLSDPAHPSAPCNGGDGSFTQNPPSGNGAMKLSVRR